MGIEGIASVGAAQSRLLKQMFMFLPLLFWAPDPGSLQTQIQAEFSFCVMCMWYRLDGRLSPSGLPITILRSASDVLL